jgi:hypothetical protein
LGYEHPDSLGDALYAIDFVDIGRDAMNRKTLGEFCGHLLRFCPRLGGFPDGGSLGGRVLATFADTNSVWTREDINHFREVASKLAAHLGLSMAMDRRVVPASV